MSLLAYDLLFGETSDALGFHPRAGADARSAHPDAAPCGWCGGRAASLAPHAWPRSPKTGFPMLHLLTIELPEAYRRKGPALTGLSLFQADDHVARRVPGVKEVFVEGAPLSPAQADMGFFQDLVCARAARPPQAVALTDLIGGHFAALWLTAAELAGPRTAPPPDRRDSVSGLAPKQNLRQWGDNLNAWDDATPEVSVFLTARPFDPNAGSAPTERAGAPYRGVETDAEIRRLAESVAGRSHLGGTCLPVQAMPEGLTPWFLELEDGVGGANFGGGNLQYDLESGVFDWACD